MSKYRSTLQIIADVLSVTADGAKKVHIMYQANLSYALTSRYLAEVIEAGLVSFVGSAGRFKLTRKGRRFLKKFDEYSGSLRWLEEQLAQKVGEDDRSSRLFVLQ